MQLVTEDNITDLAVERWATAKDPRLAEILTSLVRHLHGFAREVRLTEAEWMAAVQWLNRTGQISDEKRQEFILASDVLGLSMLVVQMNHRLDPDATPNTVLGPFHIDGSPPLPFGADMSDGVAGTPLFVHGTVRDLSGAPVAGALLDVWQADGDGMYEAQLEVDEARLRAKYSSREDGSYCVRTVAPLERDDELLLRAEHDVAVQVLRALLEQVRDERLVARHVEEEVHVGGPEVADLRGPHQLADRPVHRDRVAEWRNRAHAVRAVLARRVLRPQARLVDRELGLVHAVAVGLPDVQHRACDGRAGQVAHRAVDEERRARDPVGHVGAEPERRRAVDVERAEHGVGRGVLVEPVVHLDDEHRETQHVGGEDELLALLVADLPGAVEPLDRGHPLGLGEAHLAREAVQVPHERREDLRQAGVLGRAPPLDGQVGDVVFGDELHPYPSSSRNTAAACAMARILPAADARGRYFIPQSGAITSWRAGRYGYARRTRSATTSAVSTDGVERSSAPRMIVLSARSARTPRSRPDWAVSIEIWSTGHPASSGRNE